MWQQVGRDDIDKARESLGHCLAETLRRQQQELKSLRTKHADELRVLEAKQAELETLSAMIDRFADDFQGTLQTGAAPEQEPTTEAPEAALEQPLDAETTVPSRDINPPEKLAVRYLAPDFRPFRRVA